MTPGGRSIRCDRPSQATRHLTRWVGGRAHDATKTAKKTFPALPWAEFLEHPSLDSPELDPKLTLRANRHAGAGARKRETTRCCHAAPTVSDHKQHGTVGERGQERATKERSIDGGDADTASGRSSTEDELRAKVPHSNNELGSEFLSSVYLNLTSSPHHPGECSRNFHLSPRPSTNDLSLAHIHIQSPLRGYHSIERPLLFDNATHTLGLRRSIPHILTIQKRGVIVFWSVVSNESHASSARHICQSSTVAGSSLFSSLLFWVPH